MNRREFIRSILISSTLVATGIVGIAEMAVLIQKNQISLQVPTVSSVQSQSSQIQSTDSTQLQSVQTQTTLTKTTQGQTTSQTTQQQTSSTTSTTTQQQNASTTVASTSSQVPADYVLITQLSSLAGQTSAYFTHPNYGSSIFVNVSSQWKAFSAVCTHRVCTLQYRSPQIYCPCHGGTFSTSNGSVTGGPPPRKIAEYGVQIIGNDVYVSTSTVN